jgi:hypothetical protein
MNATIRLFWKREAASAAITALVVFALALFGRQAHGDGLPLPPPPQPSQSCLMTALQMAYLTGRREVGYANTEACLLFTRSRGAVLPYGYYRPYVPPGYFVPPGWVPPR